MADNLPERRRGTPTILAIGQMTNAVGRSWRLGIHAWARAHGWTVISQYNDLAFMEDWIRDWRPDAILMTFCYPRDIARALARAPTVAAMCHIGDLAVPAIDVDEAAVARMAADHLTGLGLRNFAVFGLWKYHWAVARARAFEQFIKDAGFDCHRSRGNELRERSGLASSASGPVISQWIRSLPKPIGIFAVGDLWGQILANYCRAVGVRVPEDAAIIGVDNDEVVCEISEPPLSSVAINWEQIGYEAATMAGKLARGEPVKPILQLVKPAGVVVRQSSDLLAVKDKDVAAALQVIRQHADRPLTVEELLRRVAVDRRRLQQRFRDQVGRRILQELRRVHIEQAKRLLASTDLSMPQIAERSGFANATKLGIAFRSETGVTPTAYRSRFRLRP